MDKCPVCTVKLTDSELDQFATKLTENGIKAKIKSWNNLISKKISFNKRIPFKELKELEKQCRICWFLDLDDEEDYDNEEDYKEALQKAINGLPEDTQYAYKNEKEFINNWGFCGHCKAIMARPPETLKIKGTKKDLNSYYRRSEHCFYCGRNNLSVILYGRYDERSYDDIPGAFLTVINE